MCFGSSECKGSEKKKLFEKTGIILHVCVSFHALFYSRYTVMTSEIPNNIISSRSEGDLVKLFWTCLFCPSIFLARVFYSAVQHFFARTENWGGVLFCFFFGLFLLHSFLVFF